MSEIVDRSGGYSSAISNVHEDKRDVARLVFSLLILPFGKCDE